MVIESTHREPHVVADRIIKRILDNRLSSDEVCIVLQNFGMGGEHPDASRGAPALFAHHADRLRSRSLTVAGDGDPITFDGEWLTIWMSHGIRECRSWIDGFVARYKMRQASDARIPDPGRFHFDSEGRASAVKKHSVKRFAAMQRDPRWSTEVIPGFAGQTLADLYAAAGSPPFNAKNRYAAPANRALIAWFAGVCERANEGAMDAAAFAPLRAAFPATQCSNYGSSSRHDAEHPRGHARLPWLGVTYRPCADRMAPVLYFVSAQATDAGVQDNDWRSATLRYAQTMLDANVHSYGGPHSDLSPWTYPVGATRSRAGLTQIADASFITDLYALLRSRGVDEILLWNGNDALTKRHLSWHETERIIDEVWSMQPVQIAVDHGAVDTRDAGRLRLAHRDSVEIEGEKSGDTWLAAMRVTFAGRLLRVASDRSLSAVIEAQNTTGPVSVRARIHNENAASIESAPIANWSGDRTSLVLASPTSVPVEGSATLTLTFQSTVPFRVSLDCVQLLVVPTNTNLN